MTRSQANRLLDAVRGGAPCSETLITAALCMTGDLGGFDPGPHSLTTYIEEWQALRVLPEEIAA